MILQCFERPIELGDGEQSITVRSTSPGPPPTYESLHHQEPCPLRKKDGGKDSPLSFQASENKNDDGLPSYEAAVKALELESDGYVWISIFVINLFISFG